MSRTGLKMFLRFAGVLLILASGATVLLGQTATAGGGHEKKHQGPLFDFSTGTTGLPPFGSFSGGTFDTVNNADLNIHFAIPVITRAGRGLPFTYSLDYESTIWTPSGGSWEPGVSNWGWNDVSSGSTGYIVYSQTEDSCMVGKLTYYYYYYNYGPYVDPLGTSHGGRVSTTMGSPSDECNIPAVTSGTSLATDGSGYNLVVTNTFGVSVYTPSGTQIVPVTGANSSGSVIDSNGNEITFSTNTVGQTTTTSFEDTLGNDPVLTVSNNTTAGSPVTLSYTGAGGLVSATVNYENKTVETNFGCNGVAEFPATQEYLVSSVDLPDGSSYTFTYEQTPQVPGNTTGRLASVTLPTGGTITYSYPGANDGTTCADGSPSALDRTTPDGEWQYSKTESGTTATTTITDPSSNQTVIDSQTGFETERTVYAGSSTKLVTTDTCYNGASIPCTTTTINLPISMRAVRNTLYSTSTIESETVTDYDKLSQVTEVDEYGYGTGAVGSLVRKTLTPQTVFDAVAAGGSCTPGTNNNVCFERPAKVQVYNGSTLNAETDYTYYNTVTSTTGTPQHINPLGDRGNLETVTKTVKTGTTVSGGFTYYDTGTLNTSTDFNGNRTTYVYGSETSTCGNAFPTSIMLPLSFTNNPSMTWDCSGAVETSATDVNAQTTGYGYKTDPFWRLITTTLPNGGWTTNQYTDAANGTKRDVFTGLASNNYSLTSCPFATGSPACRQDEVALDSQGRVNQTTLVSDSSPDIVNTTYDANGRVLEVTNPYQSAPTGYDQYLYDALNRVLSVTHADGNVANTYYGANVTTTLGGITTQLCTSYGLGYPALIRDESSGHTNFRRQQWTDALGRLIEVDEVDGTGAMSQATCYAYDALNDLTQVYAAGNSGGQTRSYTYDELGRLTLATLPESGTTQYSSYDGNGNLLTRIDARNITTTYKYDALNRLTSKTYTDGTPTANFFYDKAPASWPAWSGVNFGNGQGRLALTCTGTAVGSCGSLSSPPQTATAYSYDPVGNVTSFWQCAPFNCGSSSIWEMAYSFDYGSDMLSRSYPDGLHSNTYAYNSAQEIFSVGNPSGDNITYPTSLITDAYYEPWGAPYYLDFGAVSSGTSLREVYQYNSRLQPNQIELGTPGVSNANGCLIYNYYQAYGNPVSCAPPGSATSGNNGSVAGYYYLDNANSSLTHGVGYTYDVKNRIATATESIMGSPWGYQFTDDRYGNLTTAAVTQGSAPGLSVGVNGNNQIDSPYYAYDAAGDMTNDGSIPPSYDTFTYDAEGRVTGLSAMGYSQTNTLNALGEPVQFSNSGGGGATPYDVSGLNLGQYGLASHAWTTFYMYAGSRQIAWLSDNGGSNNFTHFIHINNIGSTTQVTDQKGAEVYDLLWYPFGTQWTTTNNETLGSFGDTIYASFPPFDRGDNNNDGYFRSQEGRLGRWLRPDPLGGDISNPQTLNRYTYALNSPTTLIDPLGLYFCVGKAAPCNTGHNGGLGAFLYGSGGGFYGATGGIVDIQSWQTVSGDENGDPYSYEDLTDSYVFIGSSWLTDYSGGTTNSTPCSVSSSSLNSYLGTKGSPMVGQGTNLMNSGQQYNIDPRLFVSLAGAETSFATNITAGQYNAFNVLYSGLNSPFPSWKAAINSVGYSLTNPRNGYDLTSTATMYGTYCTTGSTCGAGLNNVNTFMGEQGASRTALHYPCKQH